MKSRKPHVVVFFGGEGAGRDLSLASGQWVCQYIPRTQYQVTPVHIQSDGSWQVPLGSLPQGGTVKRMIEMLFTAPGRAVRAVSPAVGLQKLLARPVDAMMTLLRGRGGDDGALHALGDTVNIPVIGSGVTTSQLAHHKQHYIHRIGDIASLPHTLHYQPQASIEDMVAESHEQLIAPLFVKAAEQDGSVGTELIHTSDELRAAINRIASHGDVLLQEKARGTELAVSLFREGTRIRALPTTMVTPRHASFYDYLSKRRSGRADLTTAPDSPLVTEAETIAHDIYTELGCQGCVTIDMVADDDSIDVLDINTIPVFSAATPLTQQLQTARLAPEAFLNTLIHDRLNYT